MWRTGPLLQSMRLIKLAQSDFLALMCIIKHNCGLIDTFNEIRPAVIVYPCPNALPIHFIQWINTKRACVTVHQRAIFTRKLQLVRNFNIPSAARR
jgi:hypothetical protein